MSPENQQPSACRFCFEISSEPPSPLLSPCRCRGSVANIHRSCLVHWMQLSGTDRCNICRAKYTGIKYRKTYKSMWQFLWTTGLWSYFLLGVLAYLVMIAAMVQGIVECYQNEATLLPTGVLAIGYLMLAWIMTATIAQAGNSLWKDYRRWRMENSVVVVLDE